MLKNLLAAVVVTGIGFGNVTSADALTPTQCRKTVQYRNTLQQRMQSNLRTARNHKALARTAQATQDILRDKPQTAVIVAAMRRQHQLVIWHTAGEIRFNAMASQDKANWQVARATAWNKCGQ